MTTQIVTTSPLSPNGNRILLDSLTFIVITWIGSNGNWEDASNWYPYKPINNSMVVIASSVTVTASSYGDHCDEL